jgi:predicted PurR-regulated permease PerM
MRLERYNVYFFLLILFGVTALTFFLFKPILVSFVVAAILAHLFEPLYQKFLKMTKNKKGISSALSCITIGLIIIVPLVLMGVLLVNEIQDLVDTYSNESESYQESATKLIDSISRLPIVSNFQPEQYINHEQIAGLVTNFSKNALVILQKTYQGVMHLIFIAFIIFFSLFYLFIDGKKLVKKFIMISPLQDSHENLLLKHFSSTVRGVIKGTILIGLIQGALAAFIFAVTGVGSPILLGILTAIASLIPTFGTALVWVPVGVIMIAMGNVTEGIVILLFGALVIGTIDNVIRPKLVGDDTQIHPLLILFSTLGGIAMFGIIGFAIGPIIVSFFLSLWEIYLLEFKEQLISYNKSGNGKNSE